MVKYARNLFKFIAQRNDNGILFRCAITKFTGERKLEEEKRVTLYEKKQIVMFRE